ICAPAARRTRRKVGNGREAACALPEVRAARPCDEIRPNFRYRLTVPKLAQFRNDVWPKIVLRAVELSLQGDVIVENLDVVAAGIVAMRNSDVEIDHARGVGQMRNAERIVCRRNRLVTARVVSEMVSPFGIDREGYVSRLSRIERKGIPDRR